MNIRKTDFIGNSKTGLTSSSDFLKEFTWVLQFN